MEMSSAVSTVLFVLLTISLGVLWMCDATVQVVRPRGVSLSNEPLYNAEGKGDWFTCVDGSKKILRSQINDDYCDCPDSSDEPGTSACPNGRFHCSNRGFRPTYIPSSRVNDGICDCCDTSDEYEGPGVGRCINNCKELGKKELEEKKQQMALFNQGFDIRKQYVTDGQAKKIEREEELKKLQVDREGAQSAMEEKKKVRDDMEAPETAAKDKHKAAWDAEVSLRKAEDTKARAIQAFKELDFNADGNLVVHELTSRLEFDADNSGDVNEEEAKGVLGGLNIVDEATFVENVWNNIEDKFQFASHVAAEQAAAASQLEGQEVPLPDDEVAAFDDDTYDDEDDFEDDIEEEDDWADDDDFDDDEGDDFDEATADEVRELQRERRLDRQARRKERREQQQTTPGKDEMPDYDEETKALIAAADQARADFNEAERNLKTIDRSISDLEKQLRVDLGPDQEFQALQGQCYEYTDREYTYKLCPFEKSSQRSKHGGSETSLGTWQEWKGPSDDKYAVMMYTKGQKCWNGPDRSTKVLLRCGTENQVISASEPDRCVYQFEFTTPALCTNKYDMNTGETLKHDEL